MSLFREIDRAEWRSLTDAMCGSDDVEDAVVTSRPGSVDIETDQAQVTVYPHKGATDIRVGHVQVLVGRSRVVVLHHAGQFPVQQWSIVVDEEL